MSQKGISGKIDLGVRLNLHPEDQGDFVHVQRSDDGTTSTIEREWRVPGTQKQVHDPLPPTKGTKFYRTRGIGRTNCVTASSWTPWRKARGTLKLPEPNVPKLPIGKEVPRAPGRASLKEVVQRLRDSGTAQSNLLVGTSSIQFPINRHTEEDLTVDGGTVTFADSYESPPTIVFVPQRATSQTTQLSPPVKMNMRATNKTVSGYNPKLELESSTGTQSTPIEDGFSSTQNSGAPETGDVTLTNDGDVCFSNLEDANDKETTYKSFFKYSTTGMVGTVTITVHLDVNDGSTSTSWTNKDSKQLGAGVSSTKEKLSFTDALNTDFDLRGRLTYSASSGSGQSTVTFFGESTNSAQSGVEYDKITSVAAVVSMTTGDSDKVLGQAYEKS